MHSDIKAITKHNEILKEYDTYAIVSILEWDIIGRGILLLVIFVLRKLPYPHCYLWNKIKMPTIKLLKKWMHVFNLQQIHKLVPLSFVMCFHSNAWHKIAPFVCLATATYTLHDHVFCIF